MTETSDTDAGRKKTGPLFLTVLAAMTAIAPLSLHMFFPAIPDIKNDFGVSEAIAELTLSVPLFVMAFMTLAYGSLSDRFGRRPVLLGAVALFVIGGLCALVAESIWLLLAGRVLQAAGGAGGLGLARAIARDIYGTDRLVKVIAYLTMAYTLGPMIATPLGAALIDYSGWRAVVGLAVVAGVVLAVLSWLVLYETHTDRVAVGLRTSPLTDIVRLFSNPRFAGYVMQSGFSTGAFFSMASASAFLLTEYLHRPPSEYGLYFTFFPVGFLIGNFISSRLGGKVSIEAMVFGGAVILVCTAAGQAAFVAADIVTPMVIFLPGFFVTLAQGIALPNSQSGAIIEAGPLAGTGAGIGVFVQLFFAGVFIQVYGIIADGTPVPMSIAVCISATLSIMCGAVPFLMKRRGL